uniref:Uncharacterized protein n=1 Tax=Aegilops tauschii subsp. strangulata TaxID=200361 RepID=A0A453QVM3_AEGTS
ARPRMASTSSLDLGKIVPTAGFLLHRCAAVPSAPVLRGRSASGRCGLAVSVSSSNGRSAFTCPPLFSVELFEILEFCSTIVR